MCHQRRLSTTDTYGNSGNKLSGYISRTRIYGILRMAAPVKYNFVNVAYKSNIFHF